MTPTIQGLSNADVQLFLGKEPTPTSLMTTGLRRLSLHEMGLCGCSQCAIWQMSRPQRLIEPEYQRRPHALCVVYDKNIQKPKKGSLR